MVCKEIIKILQQQSPEGYACEWDNVGLLVGSEEKDVRCIYVGVTHVDKQFYDCLLEHIFSKMHFIASLFTLNDKLYPKE